MKKSLAYHIRSKSDVSSIAPPADRPTQPPARKPKIKLNTAPVPTIRELHQPKLAQPQTQTELPAKTRPQIDDHRPERPYLREVKRTENSSVAHSFSRPRKLHFSLVAGSAIIVGLIFGSISLHTFTRQADLKTQQAIALASSATMPASKPTNLGSSAGAGRKTEPAVPGTALTLPQMQAFYVQCGVFSAQQSADTAAAAVKKLGWKPAVSPEDGKYYVYAAAAATNQEAQGIANILHAAGQDVYIKERTFPEVSINIQGQDNASKKLPNIGQAESEQFQRLSTVTFQGFTNGKADPSSIQKLAAAQQALGQQGKEIAAASPQAGQQITKEVSDLHAAAQDLEQFSKKPDKSVLFQTQASLLSFLANRQQVEAQYAK